MNDFLGVILWLVAWILKLVLSPILLLYGIIESYANKELGNYFENIAISLDVSGNVLGKYLFNKALIKANGYKFGSRYETISYVLGINNRDNTLTLLGRLIGKLLNIIDKNHLNKAIDNEGRS